VRHHDPDSGTQAGEHHGPDDCGSDPLATPTAFERLQRFGVALCLGSS
jgi:hypothetical protein